MPGAIPGIEPQLKKIQTIGFTAALTLQSLVIIDVRNVRWGSKKAIKRIVSYVTEQIDPSDEYTLSNGLVAVQHIHSKNLLPFWFQCLAMESDPIRIHTLAGLTYYIYDRTHGLFTWKPEEEISPAMIENLKRCLDSPSYYIQQEAQDIIDKLKEAGLVL